MTIQSRATTGAVPDNLEAPRLPSGLAGQLVASAVHRAATDGRGPVAAAVTDSCGHVLAFLRGDQAPLRASRLATMKAYTASRFGQATADVARQVAASGRTLSEYGDRRFTGLAGGVPIMGASGVLIGALGVSGRAPADDDVLARTVLATAGLGPGQGDEPEEVSTG